MSLCFTRIMQTSVFSYFYLIGYIPVAVHHDVANYIIRVYSNKDWNDDDQCFAEVKLAKCWYTPLNFLGKIKGLKETTHGYKKNETKGIISHVNCNTMFLFFLHACK